MTKPVLFTKLTLGLDLGDKSSRVCGVNAEGVEVRSETVLTTPAAIREMLSALPVGSRVVMEVGAHSPWVSRQAAELGHEVVVANPSAVYGKRRRKKRNDRLDANYLARQGRADPELLHPIRHRGLESQAHLEVIRARDTLVRARSRLVNHVRGSVKQFGVRVGRCSAPALPKRARSDIPQELREAFEPVLATIEQLSAQIRTYDQRVAQLVSEHYPEAVRLQQPAGVGALTALAYVLLIEDPKRFEKSRDVGAYFGLCPALDESGDSQPQLRISKTGDELGRRLLVGSAQYILGPFGPDCDLRRHGLAIAARGGKNAKKRAAVAVARKLAVMLHRLWMTGATYDPDRLKNRRKAA